MTQAKFLGVRLSENIVAMVEQTAKEEMINKTEALKELIVIGRKQLLLTKYLNLYREGKCSLDKVAEATGLTLSEVMDEAAKAGIKHDLTVEEYQEGLALLK
ncbi:MAG: hypothetical protein AABX70_03720 [Nanoarchaeota archaeon]